MEINTGMVFRKNCWGEALLPTGTIHKSAHTSCTVKLRSFTLAAATKHRCTYHASHEQCFPLVHRITGCLRQNVLDKWTLHNMQLQRCMSLVLRHSLTLTRYLQDSFPQWWEELRTSLASSENVFSRNQDVAWAMTKWAPSTKERSFKAYVLSAVQSVPKTGFTVTMKSGTRTCNSFL